MSTLKLVFSKPPYIGSAIAISAGLFVTLSLFSGYIFVKPFLVFHVPGSEVFSFSLLVMISTLTGIVTPMGIYRIKKLRVSSRKMSPGIFGSVIGAGAGACGCLSMNTALLSVFGTVGGSAISFSTEYAVPLRLVSIAILSATFVFTTRAITLECKIRK